MAECVSKARRRSYLIISIALIVLSVGLTFSFFWPVCIRFYKTLVEDFFQSVVFFGKSYVSFFTGDKVDGATPAIAFIPDGIEEILPFEWEDFAAKFERFWAEFFNWDRFTTWFEESAEDFAVFLLILLPIVAVLAVIVGILVLVYKKENNNFGKKSRPLLMWLKIERKMYLPVKKYIKGYFEYFSSHKWLKIIMGIVWAFNANLFALVLESLAWILYLCGSFDFASIWTLIVRLVYDLSVPIRMMPLVAGIVAWRIFDKTRKKIGLAMLRFYESVNVEFLKKYLGALFLVGKQRAKKTTIITDMALSQEVIFREEAFELLKKRAKQFPHFPWQELENFYWNNQDVLPTLASYREFVKLLRSSYASMEKYKKWPKLEALLKQRLKRRYGYDYDNYCFGYDIERYGEMYNDNLTIVNLFDAIEGYVQLFYVYAAPTPLIFGNYSIRTDLQWQDSGNFPLLDSDFFSRPAEEMKETSQYCHVAKMDCFRLGTVANPADPYIDGFEVGILNMMEGGKERGNQKTNESIKASDSGVNAKNDGFEMDIKMRAHGSTIDNYTFFRFFIDEQRPDSLMADNRELCSVIMIKEVSEAKVVLPGTLLEKFLYAVTTGIYDKVYYTLRNLRGDADGTLLVYLLKKAYIPIFRHWDRIQKEYSVHVAKLKVTDAMQDKVLAEGGKYYICPKKTYSDRFATDAIKQFYHNKTRRSRYGLNDFPMYEGKHMTVKEMEASGSIFYRKIINAFHNTDMQRQIIEAKQAKMAKKGK